MKTHPLLFAVPVLLAACTTHKVDDHSYTYVYQHNATPPREVVETTTTKTTRTRRYAPNSQQEEGNAAVRGDESLGVPESEIRDNFENDPILSPRRKTSYVPAETYPVYDPSPADEIVQNRLIKRRLSPSVRYSFSVGYRPGALPVAARFSEGRHPTYDATSSQRIYGTTPRTVPASFYDWNYPIYGSHSSARYYQQTSPPPDRATSWQRWNAIERARSQSPICMR